MPSPRLPQAIWSIQRESLTVFVLKLNRKKRLLTGEALLGFEALAGLVPSELLRKLREDAPAEIARWLHDHAGLGCYLDSLSGGPRFVLVSTAPDEVVSVAPPLSRSSSWIGNALHHFRLNQTIRRSTARTAGIQRQGAETQRRKKAKKRKFIS